MAEADTVMNKPQWTTQINLGNVLTLCLMLGGFLYGYGELNNKIENLDNYRAERSRQTDQKFEALGRTLENLPNLSYRVTANEEAIKATNQRVEASISNISSRLAEMNQYIGSIDTKLAVLTQRLENADGRRAELRPSLRPALPP